MAIYCKVRDFIGMKHSRTDNAHAVVCKQCAEQTEMTRFHKYNTGPSRNQNKQRIENSYIECSVVISEYPDTQKYRH